MSITQKEEKPKSKLRNTGESFTVNPELPKTLSSNGTSEGQPPERKALRAPKKGAEYKPDQGPTSTDFKPPQSQPGIFQQAAPQMPTQPFVYPFPQQFIAQPGFAGHMQTPYQYMATGFMQPQMYMTNQAPGNHNFSQMVQPIPAPIPTPAQNPQQQYLSDENTSKLAHKLKEKTDQKKKEEHHAEVQPPAAQPKAEPAVPAPTHPEVEKAARKESAAKVEAPVVATVEKKDSDEENLISDDEEDESEEDYSKYPQEKPAKIMYTRDMILEFIEKEKAKPSVLNSEQLEDLERDISIVNKAKDFGSAKRYGTRNKYDKPGGGYDRRDRGGGGYRPSDRKKTYASDMPSESSKPTPFVRPVYTEEEKQKIKNIKESTDLLGKQVDDATRLKKEINLVLFKLTEENKETIFQEMKQYCTKYEECQTCVRLLIDKAWSHAKYTKIYAELCSELGNVNADLFEGMPEDKVNEILEKQKEREYIKIFKNFVVHKVRKEFMDGFEKFKQLMESAESNTEYSDEDKTAVYQKNKGKFLSNMAFIAELYKRKYLPHKVMRFITYHIMSQFADDYNKKSTEKLMFPTYEVFVEALFKIMETCGDEIEAKEESAERKKDAKTAELGKQSLEKYVKTMMDSLKHKTFSHEAFNKIFSDDDKKEVNFITASFRLLFGLKQAGMISTRLSSLIENASENRKTKWRSSGHETGPKKISEVHKDVEMKTKGPPRSERRDEDYGDRRYSKKYPTGRGGYDEYDDEFVPKNGHAPTHDPHEYKVKESSANAAPKKVDIKLELKALFDTNKTTDVLEIYDDLFKPDNPALAGATGKEIFAAYLDNFHNCSREIAMLRINIVNMIVVSFALSESDFYQVLATYMATGFTLDIPVLKKALSKILILSLTNCNFKIENLKLIYGDSEDEREEQKWFYADIFEEVKKELESTGDNKAYIDSISPLMQSFK